MITIAHRQEWLQAGLLSLAAALSAVSLATVSYQGGSAGKLAFLGVGLLALAGVAALVYLRPLAAIVLALVFMTSPLQLVLTQQPSAMITAVLLAGAVLGFALRTPLRQVVPDPMFLPIGTFAVYGCLSAVYGLLAGNPAGYLFGDCFQLLEFALVYFLIAQSVKNRLHIRLLLKIWLASMLVTVLVELFLFVIGPTTNYILPSWEGHSVSEELVRTINIGATILFAILINLYPRASRKQRVWIWMALIPTVANIALSLSRGLWLCTLVIVLVSLALQGRDSRVRLGRTLGMVGVCVILLAGVWKIGSDSSGSLLTVFEERVFHGVDQMQEGFAGSESMATRRFLEIAIVSPQIWAMPWIGHGLGATYVIGGYAVLGSPTRAQIDHHFIHNLYLVTAFRMGVIGLALLLWTFIRYLRRARRALRNMAASPERSLLVGLVACIVGQIFLSITEPTILEHPTCGLVACAMALSFKVARNSSNLCRHSELQHGL